MPKSKEMISDSDSASGSEEEVKQKSKPAKKSVNKAESSGNSGSESEEEVKQKSKPAKKAPKKKDSGSESESDGDSKSRKRPSKGKDDKGSNKKVKTDSSSSKNENGEEFWELGNSKRCTVRSFKGKLMVDIREFYDAGGEMKPGKKGIALQMDNWRKLLSIIDEVDKVVKSQ